MPFPENFKPGSIGVERQSGVHQCDHMAARRVQLQAGEAPFGSCAIQQLAACRLPWLELSKISTTEMWARCYSTKRRGRLPARCCRPSSWRGVDRAARIRRPHRMRRASSPGSRCSYALTGMVGGVCPLWAGSRRRRRMTILCPYRDYRSSVPEWIQTGGEVPGAPQEALHNLAPCVVCAGMSDVRSSHAVHFL